MTPESVHVVLLELPPVKRRRGTWRVVVSIETWRGRRSLHVRWNRLGDDGTWRPTREGATVPVDRLPDLSAAIADATRKLGNSSEIETSEMGGAGAAMNSELGNPYRVSEFPSIARTGPGSHESDSNSEIGFRSARTPGSAS